MYGSGGSEVAGAVAHELEWSLLDNAVVDAVAERTGLTTSEVAAREERVPSLVERLADAMRMSSQEMLLPRADPVPVRSVRPRRRWRRVLIRPRPPAPPRLQQVGELPARPREGQDGLCDGRPLGG